MKCALIIPSWIPEDIFSAKTAGSQINYWQPVGTLSVAAVLQQAGHDVAFLNGAFLTHAAILEQIEQDRPRFVGLYATAFGWSKAKRTAEDLKRLYGNMIYICVGGPYPIALQEKCLEDAGHCVDAVVTGEGEHTIIEMVERIGSGRDLDGVLGTVWRAGDNIRKNPARPLITDLDSLPIPAR